MNAKEQKFNMVARMRPSLSSQNQDQTQFPSKYRISLTPSAESALSNTLL